MVINTNISAQTSSALLSQNSSKLSKSLSRLSSGTKITSPEDDSAGLAVSMKLTAQMSRIDGATNNVGNAVSFNQTQDGYLQKVNDALNRMSELSVLAQDVTKATGDRALYNQEFSTLASYVHDVSSKDFNGVSLFTGTGLSVTTDSDANTYKMTGVSLSSTTYSNVVGSWSGSTKTGGDSIDTSANAKTALGHIKAGLNQLATDRAAIGANIESLTMYNDQLGTLKNNLSAANSRITDVDVAQESTQYAKYNILVQTGTAMLAQANALPQSALRLLS
jgi:flagellin